MPPLRGEARCSFLAQNLDEACAIERPLALLTLAKNGLGATKSKVFQRHSELIPSHQISTLDRRMRTFCND